MMLFHLKLQDLILIEKAEIEFGDGLNIFTGETGSGKSAILTAIRLITGERADSEWIRANAAVAIVEAKFGDRAQVLTVRREIHRSGKSRSFIEDRLVTSAELRELSRPLLEMVGQSSSKELCVPEKQRKIVDAYGGLEKEAALLSDAFKKMVSLKKELESAVASSENRSRDLEWAESSLKEIEEANWQKEEEESLTQSHLFLSHTQELTEKTTGAAEGLSSLAPHLRQLAHLLEGAVLLDPHLHPYAGAIKTAALEIDDTEHSLRSYISRLEADPGRLARLESRIGEIEALKRRYGRCWEEVQLQKERFAAEIDRLTNLDDRVSAFEKEIKKLEEATHSAANDLSEKRQCAAKTLSSAVSDELKCLNLPHSKFEIQISPKSLSSDGADEIRFLFTANPGLTPLPLEQCASGGELSRLLFATKVALAEKDQVQCLIFDEIDSNVGGQTATVLGEKLKELSKKRQVICVTHFVQVARLAMHHFAVVKHEQNGRAATFVEKLETDRRGKEYARMIGN